MYLLLVRMDVSLTNNCILNRVGNVLMQEEAKPIDAAKESRAILERLLPITTPDPSIKDWTVDGFLAHAKQVAAEEEVLHHSGEIFTLSKLL